MRKIRTNFLLFAYMLIAMTVWLSFTRIAHGETRVAGTTIMENTIWDKQHSPYILDGDIRVFVDTTLTIDAGVEIKPGFVSQTSAPAIRTFGGTIQIKGKPSDRVKIEGLQGIFVTNGLADIANTDISGNFGLSFENSRATIATTTISGTSRAIRSKDSVVQIWDSRIENNLNGIRIEPHQIFQVLGDGLPETGGIGNALAIGTNSSFTISNSVIASNGGIGLANFAEYPAMAENNWWGTAEGPKPSGSNNVTGNVVYKPWLANEPILDPPQPECCSSILFIPGLQASRLNLGDNRLWEPNRNEDVRKLYLNSDGSSMDPAIYSDGPIDKAYGMVSVYGKFLEFLDGLANEEIIKEWKVFGYDWRKPITEVVAGRENRATTTESLIEVVNQLASSSKTGKVTLIAHSNGGLVAKYLTKMLADHGRADLIDTIISAAVPYLGTPQAILSLLHGHNQSIAKGLFLSEEVAKTWAENMSSAYSLLPSAEYFSKIFGPTIVQAGTAAETHQDQTSFIAGSANNLLLTAANAFHEVIDNFYWPANISRFAIIGWNTATSKSLNYKDKNSCMRALIGFECKNVTTYFASTTMMGDGTVVSPSAAHDSGEVISLDLQKVQDSSGKDIVHSNILESPTTREIIKEIIVKGNSNLPELPSGASWGEPDYSREPNMLVVSTHSPVELHVYDSTGNHTGPIAGPPDVEEGLIMAYENEIPGSDFSRYGSEADPEMYVYLPADDQEYSIILKGTDVGVATLEIEKVRDGETLDRITFNSLPVMPITIASTSVTSSRPASSPIRLASSTPALKIDIDGNGSVDASVENGNQPDPILNIEMIRKTVATLLGTSTRAKDIDRRLIKLQGLIREGKLIQVQKMPEKIEKQLGHKKFKGIPTSDKELIIEAIELLITQFEQVL